MGVYLCMINLSIFELGEQEQLKIKTEPEQGRLQLTSMPAHSLHTSLPNIRLRLIIIK